MAIAKPSYRRGSKKSTDISVGVVNGKPSLQVNWGGRIYGAPLSLLGSGNVKDSLDVSDIRATGNITFSRNSSVYNNSNRILMVGGLTQLGDKNMAIGSASNLTNMIGNSTYSFENIAIGTDVLKNAAYGRYNVFMGYQAGENFGDDCAADADVYGNIAIGRRAYRCVDSSNVVGVNNVAIGFGAMEQVAGGNGNTCIGFRTGEGLQAGYNTLIGYNAGYNSGSGHITTGTNNICISGGDATSSSAALTNANDDTFAISIGAYCKAGDYAIAMGKTAIASGEDSIALGIDTDATGTQSIAIGDGAQATGNQSIAIGDASNASAAGAVAIGKDAASSVTSTTVIANTDIILDAAGDITLDADGDQVSMKFGGVDGQIDFTNANSGDGIIQQKVDAKDLVIQQFDGNEVARFTDGGDVKVTNVVYFAAETANTIGDGATGTIDWNTSQKQKVTITGTGITCNFTNPPGACNLLLKVVQGDGSDVISTWDSDIKWPSNDTVPTLSTGNGDIDIISFYFDGTNYFGVASLDFA